MDSTIDCSDIYERDKQKLISALKAYGPVILLGAITGSVIDYNRTPILHLTLAAYSTWLWTYVSHRILHSSHNILFFINTHTSHHHSYNKKIPKYLDLILETIQDIWTYVIVFLIQESLSIHIVPIHILFLIGLTYVSIHIINYSIFGSDTHSAHHRNPNVNFGPDYFDHIFGTNATEEFEDMSHMIPNLLLVSMITYYLFTL